VIAWVVILFVVAVFFFCLGIVSDHRDVNSSRPFACYLIGLILMGIAVALLLVEVVNQGNPP